MIEPEIAFADLSDNMALAEDMIKYIIRYVLENCPDEMEFLNQFVDKNLLARLKAIAEEEHFAHVTYTEAIGILEKNKENFEFPVFWAATCRPSTNGIWRRPFLKSRSLSPIIRVKSSLFICALNDDGKTVAAMDLLPPALAKSLAASSVKNVWTCWKNALPKTA